jgi:hypothetical protein
MFVLLKGVGVLARVLSAADGNNDLDGAGAVIGVVTEVGSGR